MKIPFALAALTLLVIPSTVTAQPVCTQIPGASWTLTASGAKLKADCQTDTSILIPHGTTLNGNGFTITAVDPSAGHFLGAVVRNAPGATSVSVTNLIVDTANLTNACDDGNDRLRGIMFDDASGNITNNKVLHINQGPSGCQEGNAIEVRNFTSATVRTATVSGNRVYAYQKGGIIVNGTVSATVSNNIVGESATQANLAANGIQIGFGAQGNVSANQIEGNTWLGFDAETSNYSATAVLLYQSAAGTKVSGNLINLVDGNADVGIYVFADSVSVSSNRVYDWGADVAGADPDYDIGIANPGNLNGGIDNVFTKNKVRCYQDAYDNVTGGSNTVLPCTDSTSTAFGSFSMTGLASEPSVPLARNSSPFDR
jgi:hypothetical protein